VTSNDVVERTRRYVFEQFLYARTDVCLAEDELLFERGIVDSMGVVELVVFLENEFGILIDDDEVTEQHFRSLRSIADYVCSKRAIGAAT
jgi:acyl carrier protein